MLSLGTAVKDRKVVVVKAGLMYAGLTQVWTERREERGVRIRLVENMLGFVERRYWRAFFCTFWILELLLLLLSPSQLFANA